MPRIERTATITWEGNLARGAGVIAAGSRAFTELPFSIPSRIAQVEGKTSPEELLAAAHGGCFVTSLAGELTRAGSAPERIDVRVRIVMDEVRGRGHLIVGSEVDVDALVPGVSEQTFEAAVAAADESCPFSNLIRASASVTVRARLAAT